MINILSFLFFFEFIFYKLFSFYKNVTKRILLIIQAYLSLSLSSLSFPYFLHFTAYMHLSLLSNFHLFHSLLLYFFFHIFSPFVHPLILFITNLPFVKIYYFFTTFQTNQKFLHFLSRPTLYLYILPPKFFPPWHLIYHCSSFTIYLHYITTVLLHSPSLLSRASHPSRSTIHLLILYNPPQLLGQHPPCCTLWFQPSGRAFCSQICASRRLSPGKPRVYDRGWNVQDGSSATASLQSLHHRVIIFLTERENN